MNTDTTPRAATETTALTRALLEKGWAYAKPVYTEPQWRSQIHHLEHPDGRLQVTVNRYPAGNTTAQLAAEAVRTGDHRPGWMAEMHVPLVVALAAMKAATEPEPEPEPDDGALAEALTASGWKQSEDFCASDDGRLLERAWSSPDTTRSVTWLPGDDGGWIITRPGPTGRSADSQASAHTPAAAITALALTD